MNNNEMLDMTLYGRFNEWHITAPLDFNDAYMIIKNEIDGVVDFKDLRVEIPELDMEAPFSMLDSFIGGAKLCKEVGDTRGVVMLQNIGITTIEEYREMIEFIGDVYAFCDFIIERDPHLNEDNVAGYFERQGGLGKYIEAMGGHIMVSPHDPSDAYILIRKIN